VSGIGASFTSKGGGQSHVLRACGFIECKGVSIAGGSRAQVKTCSRCSHVYPGKPRDVASFAPVWLTSSD